MFRRFLAGDGSLAAMEPEVELASQTPAAGTAFRPMGGTLLLSVTPAFGAPPYIYQWFVDGRPIAGAVHQQHMATATSTKHRFYCEISCSDGGFTASGPVDLEVGTQAPPTTPGLTGSRMVQYYSDLAAVWQITGHKCPSWICFEHLFTTVC